jgi:hypothetical protein
MDSHATRYTETEKEGKDMHYESIGLRSLRAILAAAVVSIGLSALAPSASATRESGLLQARP